MIVCLDAGHSGYPDPGALGPNGTKESDITLAVCEKLKVLFEDNGHEVVMTRTCDDEQTDDLQYRCDISNEAGTDYFISVHCNSAENPSANGTEVFYYSSSGMEFANRVQDKIVELGLRDRGIKKAGFYVLKRTDAVAILVELAFISNKREEELLNDSNFQDLLATAIFGGVVDL